MQRDMVVYCPKCQGYRHFNYLAETVQVDDKAGPPARYSFGFCPQCRGPFIMVQEQYGGATFDDDKGVQVYPPNKRRLSFKVPAVVEASYLEAVRCEGNQAWIATAAMVDRTLEAVCKDEEPKSKSMFEGLQKLRKAGEDQRRALQWADQLRVLRNQGAHASEEAIEREDAVDALNFLQAILETLYHLRPMFQEMKARRSKASAKVSVPKTSSK